MLPEEIKNEIISNLIPLKPEKVILFGSYAYGIPDKESDIDLYVVTSDDFFPKNYKESLNITKKVYKALSEFRRKYATDLIVHTKPMHKKFIGLESSFSKEILTKGIILI